MPVTHSVVRHAASRPGAGSTPSRTSRWGRVHSAPRVASEPVGMTFASSMLGAHHA